MSAPSKHQSQPAIARHPEHVIPSEIAAVFLPPPLLPNEDASVYERLLTAVGVAVAPKDTIEWFWIKDIVDLLWEAQRLRRVRSALLTGARRKALDDLLDAHDEPEGHSFLNDKRSH